MHQSERVSCKRRASKAEQKGPRFLLVSKFYVWHFRFRFIFHYHLSSTLYRLSTRLEPLDGLSFNPYNNFSKVGVTPTWQMKKSKNREVNNFPTATMLESRELELEPMCSSPSSILFPLFRILSLHNNGSKIIMVKFHQSHALETV